MASQEGYSPYSPSVFGPTSPLTLFARAAILVVCAVALFAPPPLAVGKLAASGQHHDGIPAAHSIAEPLCQHVYVDLGTNVGIQIRKLFEPDLFPGALVLPLFDEYFGGDVSARREEVCAFGFEPNPNHFKRLEQLTTTYNSLGWRTHVMHAGVGTEDGYFYLESRDDGQNFQNLEWNAKMVKEPNEHTSKDPILIIDLPKWFATKVLPRKAQGGSIVFKFDFEGAEVDVFAGLALSGALCSVNCSYLDIAAEEFDMVSNIAKGLTLAGCPSRVALMDDELFHTSDFPLPAPRDATAAS
jgi:hypothetical protein